MPSINEVLERNLNWADLVRPEFGYLLASDDYSLRFIPKSDPDWDFQLRHARDGEGFKITETITNIELGEEIYVVMVTDPSPDVDPSSPEADWGLYSVDFELFDLPTPIQVED